MAAPSKLRHAIAALALTAVAALASGCGSSASDPARSASGSSGGPTSEASTSPAAGSETAAVASGAVAGQGTGARSAGAEERQRLREAIVRGEARDYASGTRVGGPAFQACLKGSLRAALDAPTLARLVQVYRRPDGQPFSAQALNALAGPLGAGCGHRAYVPEMINASQALAAGALTGASVGRLGVAYGPYLGVRCLRAGRIGCDRVGIDIVFSRAARSVVAVLDGRHLPLHTPGMHTGVRRHDWVGTLDNAGMTTRGSPFWIGDTYGPGKWAGYPAVYVPIEFRVAYADGRRARARFGKVFLSPGWG